VRGTDREESESQTQKEERREEKRNGQSNLSKKGTDHLLITKLLESRLSIKSPYLTTAPERKYDSLYFGFCSDWLALFLKLTVVSCHFLGLRKTTIGTILCNISLRDSLGTPLRSSPKILSSPSSLLSFFSDRFSEPKF